MHYLQSLLTLLIASDIPAERIWGILHSAEFAFHEGNVIRPEWGWLSASALRREMKKRASLCAELNKELSARVARLSTLSWETKYLYLDAGTRLIRHKDGTIECQALKRIKFMYDTSLSTGDMGPERESWENDPGLQAYQKRLYLAWIAERFLCFAVKIGDEHHIWRFRQDIADIDKFIKLGAPSATELMEMRKRDLPR